MKAFTTIAFAASLALTSAQVTYNETTGVYTCAQANAAYCAGDSLSTNIIIRCNGFVGQPGNCDDNLDGEPPVGLNFAPCYQVSPTSGQAACTKNCIVYGGSGTINGTFPLPRCAPSFTSSTTSTVSATTAVSSSSVSIPLTTVTYSYTTVTVPCNFTSSYPTAPATNSSSGAPSTIINGTVIASTATSAGNGGSGGSGGSATATPVGPTSSPAGPNSSPTGATTSAPASFTGAASAHQVEVFLAAAGVLVAALL